MNITNEVIKYKKIIVAKEVRITELEKEVATLTKELALLKEKPKATPTIKAKEGK